MKARVMIMLGLASFILTGCGSDDGNHSEMKAAIQMEAEDQGYSNIKWPFFEEDWHFEKKSDGNYTSHGTFRSNGKSHEFSAEVDPDSDMILDFYAD
ncbi:hypothetical protein H5S09_06845 [Limosilactobacillus sp. STM2_1]|uniref:PepSY domain-containing protein n=1 Tax=Limosilactobacillus rudii TaxID=2759755 RepID=A0A7W3UL88_9LACO|nr:hypothetical protein [Limosilactobacillus rudii]MBB1078791.1 hypothetical protein [Limosilactobacillus rudii]MBB1097657.1 hypothetical protein [Limosilactobacillus rudii]MCD7134766.1 hypothetical protein [Limosilactobacillus rudii]